MMEEKDMAGPLHWAAGYSEENSESQTSIRSLAEVERTYIEKVLSLCHGNIPKAAKLLKISPSTIYRKQSRWRTQQD